MKRKVTRWLLPLLVAVFATFALVTPVLAIADPESISIDAVYVYRNCREEGDQLYLVSYTIAYNVTPPETAYEAYMCRFMSGGDAIKASSIYAYYNKGYGEGVVAFYFAAGDAPEWAGDYEIVLMGNPFLEWDADAPQDSMESADFAIWQDNPMATTKHVVSSRIFSMAEDLETAWGLDMVLEVTDEGKFVLTTYGIAYFSGVVPYLSEIAPYLYASGQMPSEIIAPDIPGITDNTGYADYLESIIGGTIFDLTPVADIFGVSRGALSAVLYYGMLVIFVVLAGRRIGSYKPIMLFSLPLVILGAFVGVPLIVTILVGFLALGFTAYALFYKGSTA